MKVRSVVLPLILVNVLVYLAQNLIPGFTSAFVLNTGTFLSQPWTLITSMFMHSPVNSNPGIVHLVFNMYALFLFGPLVEQRIGWKRFLGAYLISGVIAALGFIAYQELILGVSGAALGASGAIMAVLGLTIMLFPKMKVLFFFLIPMTMRTAGIIFALIDIFGLFHSSGIANSAHLAGLAAGLIYGAYLLKKGKEFRSRFEKAKKSRIITVKNKNNNIHMDEAQIDDYLKNGKL